MTDFSKVQVLRKACLDNANELLLSARAIRALDLNNIAYHLASLSLEEIGKATIIVMTAAAEETAPERDRPLEKWMEDHVRKLFWALWGPTFGREKITGDQMQGFMHLANSIHEAACRTRTGATST
jgi:AbiV family abortive infection protein